MGELTAWQRAARKDKLTASDVAAVLGLSPWKTATDVWIEKRLPLEREEKPNPAMLLGSLLEDSLVGFAVQTLGIAGGRSNQWRVAPNGIMGATLDFESTPRTPDGHTEIIEAKTAGLFNPMFRSDEWGEPGTDDVPDQTLVQVAAQLICTPKAERVHVVALLGNGGGARIYHVHRSNPDVQQLLETIEERACEWWERHVVGGGQPDGDQSAASIETLKAIRRDSGESVEIDAELLLCYHIASESAKAAEAHKDEIKRRLITSLGTAERGECSFGYFQFRSESGGRRLDAARLKAELPDVFERFSEDTTKMMPRAKVKPEILAGIAAGDITIGKRATESAA